MILEGNAESSYVLKGKITSIRPVDKTLTKEGAPADAKVVGDAIRALQDGVGGSGGTQFYSHLSSITNPHEVTARQVGLGNVDNTSDMDKPVSVAQASAIAIATKAGTDAQKTAEYARSDAGLAQRLASNARQVAADAQNTADKKLKMDHLWTNNSPTSSFGAQTISLPTLNEYDWVLMTMCSGTDGLNSGTYLFKVGSGSQKTYGAALYPCRRTVNVGTDRISFGAGSIYEDKWVDSNQYNKPLEIFGLKGVQQMQAVS
jgi:hypothetical protein